jgi:hypothetical protein
MSPSIKNREDIFQLLATPNYRSKYSVAKATRICIVCEMPANRFKDCVAGPECDISAICGEYRDRYFKDLEQD